MKPSGTATTPTPWRRILRNGSVLGLVLWGHLSLFFVLTSLRARPPDDDKPQLASNDVMHARLLVVARPMAGRLSKNEPGLPRSVVRRAQRALQPRPDIPVVSTVGRVPVDTASDMPAASAYPSAASDDYGDPAVRKALRGNSSARSQPLPGASDGPMAGNFHVIPPRSIQDSVKSMGSYLNCSIVEMARNRPGQLNVVRIADAYTALGCKK